jgi:hypothetical protein
VFSYIWGGSKKDEA